MDSNRLQLSAFEAINDLVRAAAKDTMDTVGQLLPVFLTEIQKTCSMTAQTNEQREKQAELQGQLCGVLLVSLITAWLPCWYLCMGFCFDFASSMVGCALV